MPPSALVIRYPFRVRGVSQDGEFFNLDHLEVDLGEAGLALPTVRVEAEGVTDSQRAYLEAAAESAAVQAFVQVAIQVAIATPASTRLALRTDIRVTEPADPSAGRSGGGGWPAKGPR